MSKNEPTFEMLAERVRMIIGPATTGKSSIKLERKCVFEPPGKHDYWGHLWVLELPMINHYWLGTNGWNRGKEGVPKKFEDENLSRVIYQALKFLDEVPDCQERENMLPPLVVPD